MRKIKDFKIKYLTLNKHRVRAIIPKKSITLEEGIQKMREIARKYV